MCVVWAICNHGSIFGWNNDSKINRKAGIFWKLVRGKMYGCLWHGVTPKWWNVSNNKWKNKFFKWMRAGERFKLFKAHTQCKVAEKMGARMTKRETEIERRGDWAWKIEIVLNKSHNCPHFQSLIKNYLGYDFPFVFHMQINSIQISFPSLTFRHTHTQAQKQRQQKIYNKPKRINKAYAEMSAT